MKKSLFFMALCFMAMVSQAQYYYIKPTMWDNIKSTQIEFSLGGGGFFGLPTCSSLAVPDKSPMKPWDPIRKMEYANKFTPAFKFSFELETSHTGWYFGTFTDLEFNMDSYEAHLYGENICDDQNTHYEAEFEGKRFFYKNSYLNAAFAHGFKVGCFFNETVEAYFGAGAQIRYSIMEWETTEVSRVNTAISESKVSYATPGRLQLGIIGRVGVNYRITDNFYVGLSVIGDIYPIDLDNMVDRFGCAPVNGSSLGKPSKKESVTEENIAALTPNVKVAHESRRSIFTFLSVGWYWNKKYRDRTFDGY